MMSFNDPQSTLNDALELAIQGRYEEALQRHVWLHQHADRMTNWAEWVSSLSSWVTLGEMYPPARKALIDIRDRMGVAVRTGDWSVSLFYEIAVINEELREESDTARLFLDLHQADSHRAGQLYRYAEPGLVACGLYAVCATHLLNYSNRFENLRSKLRSQLSAGAVAVPSDKSVIFRWAVERSVAKEIERLLVILIAVGRIEEAEQIRASAIAEMESAEAREAIARAGIHGPVCEPS